jgi:BirA family biotin operon repressor/biotin-[acetyl-CoA-carboxylase] ligase
MAVKDQVIRMLEDNKGKTISGEQLATSLSVSRTAIWKAIRQLESEGYDIITIKNKGYQLSMESDILSEHVIRGYLSDQYPVRVYQEITSTNDVLKKLAIEEQVPEGTTLVSDYQTGGKGRLGRSFFSPKGTGIYLSMLLRPEGSVIDNLILTAQAAVAVYRAVLKATGKQLSIKWVNDLYLSDRKVCGILSEGQASMESGRLEYVIVGIGINLYEPENGFPEDIRDKAGSIMGKKSGAALVDRNLLSAEVIREFYVLAHEKTLAPEYTERNIVPGHDIIVINGKEEREAKALGILPDGRLLIKEKDGAETPLVFGEVSVRLKGSFH